MLTLCDPIGCSPPDPSARGILQARILGRAAISYASGPFGPSGSSGPRD